MLHVTPSLPFSFKIIAVSIVCDETGDWENAVLLVERSSDHTFITYRMDDRGNCHGGHYDMNRVDGVADYRDLVAKLHNRRF